MISSKEKDARTFIDDPLEYFNKSITQMHSISNSDLEKLHTAGLALRFKEQYPTIKVLRNLADRLNISSLSEINDVVPLLFPHTIFKSYPSSLLDKKRFDKMTQWLDTLTSYDLSNVDVAGCDGIDEWIDRLDEQTPLELITSSGTTGTISLMPKSKRCAAYSMKVVRYFTFQTFGKEPTEEDLNPQVDVIWPNHAGGKLGHLRMADMVKREFTGGDESRFHALYPDAISSDVMFLASKMRVAASRGELDSLEIDPKLLEKKDEYVAMQERRPQDLTNFFDRLTKELAGKRVFVSGAYPILYEISAAGLEQGVSGVFAPNSVVRTGGGNKGVTLPENFMEVIREFLGIDTIQEIYGMSEINAMHWACEHGRYHVQPWVIPFVLDPDTSEPLPRKGVQTGRAAFYDLSNESHWGGVISGDEITLDWEGQCPCGRSSVHIDHSIMRYSEKEGIDDDRISCSATQQVHDDAINFMKEL